MMTTFFGGLLDIGKDELVWTKARPAGLLGVTGEWAYDAYGNLIKKSERGNRNSPYGWECDHYPVPKSQGGSDHVDNLRPLHWRANARHGGLLGAIYGLGG
jgi:hypothetical protein